MNNINNNIKSYDFKNIDNLSKLFKTLESEAEKPPTYYDIHKICKKLGKSPPKLEKIMNYLEKLGYITSRTHFCPVCIKTDAPLSNILDAIDGL